MISTENMYIKMILIEEKCVYILHMSLIYIYIHIHIQGVYQLKMYNVLYIYVCDMCL